MNKAFRKCMIVVSGSEGVSLWSDDGYECIGRWMLHEHPGLNEDERGWLAWYRGGTDEAIPDPDHAHCLLVTSVAGLLARLNAHTDEVTVLGWEPGAHGITALPGDRIAAAIAKSPEAFAPGLPESHRNHIAIYAADGSRRLIQRVAYDDAHGVLWDPERERLWALGRESLSRWTLGADGIRCEQSYPLPDPDGHALSLGMDDELLLTTRNGAWRFDRTNETFTPLTACHGKLDVKSVSIHPDDGRLLWTEPGRKDCCGTVYCDGKPLPIVHPAYKARWVCACC